MEVEENIIKSSKCIKNIILNNTNFLIGRMPGIEAQCLVEYIDNNLNVKKINKNIIGLLEQNTGFYNMNNDDEILKFWCDTYLESLRNCTLLYRLEFNTYDKLVENYYKNIYVFSCASLYLWLPLLEGKNILVISPFEKSIHMQFSKRKHFFTTGKQQNFEYPEFNLQVLKCPNTIKGNTPFPHSNWKESYENMCNEIDKLDFDIAVLG